MFLLFHYGLYLILGESQAMDNIDNLMFEVRDIIIPVILYLLNLPGDNSKFVLHNVI